MNILFKNSQLRKLCCDSKEAQRRKLPVQRIRELRKRLDEIRDSDTLAVLRTVPQAGCHELSGNKDEQLAVNLDKGFRLVFEVADDPVPRKADNGLDWSKVGSVRIVSIEDYHG